jgi:hypothetical protein
MKPVRVRLDTTLNVVIKRDLDAIAEKRGIKRFELVEQLLAEGIHAIKMKEFLENRPKAEWDKEKEEAARVADARAARAEKERMARDG